MHAPDQIDFEALHGIAPNLNFSANNISLDRHMFNYLNYAVAHAVAGESWSEREGASGGLLARELADEIPGVIEAMRGA